MHMKTFFLLSMIVPMVIFSQETTDSYRLSDFHFSMGRQMYTHHTDDLMQLYDNVKTDFGLSDNLMDNSGYFYGRSNTGFFNFILGFTKKPTRSLNAGISYYTGNRRNLSFSCRDKTRTDTVDAGDYIIYVDSVNNTFYNFNEIISEIALSFSSIYRTAPEKTIIMYSGFGINVGYTIYSSLDYSKFSKNANVYNINGVDYENYIFMPDNMNFTTKNDYKRSLYTRLFIPMGINIRFSKDDKLFSKFYLDFAALFGFEFQNQPDSSPYMRSYSAFSSGIRYNLN